MENPTSGEETPSGSSMIARIALSDLMRVGDTAAAPLSPKLIGLDEPFESYEEVSEIEEQFLSIVSNISEATELLSPLEAACALLIKGIQTARNVHNHQVAWADLLEDLSSQVSQMGEYRDELQGKPSVADKRSLKALEQYLRVTTEILDQATKPYFNMQSGIWENIKRASIVQKEKEEIARYRQRVSNAWQFYSASMTRALSLKLDRIENRFDDYERVSNTTALSGHGKDTYAVVGSNFRLAYGEKVDVCEQGTRTQVLEAIRRWAVDIDAPEQIFWLNDAGGTGKSTIAATMAKEWQLEDNLAGRFFFSPNARVTERTEEFCLAIAEDIKFNQYTLWDKIDQAIQKKSPEHRFHFDIQLQQLVIEPLQSLQTTHPIYLVIDALDNCADREQREVLLETFIRHLPSIRHLKVLLTSRPLQDISNILKGSSLVYELGNQLLDSGSVIGSDIALYVNRELGGTPKITSDQREMIVTQSGGLFLYASTVCRMLKKSHRLSEVLKYFSVVEPPQDVEDKMDELYLSVLKQAIVDDTAGQLLMDLLSIITVTFEPVSINTIGAFLPDNDQIDNFVQDLSGVLIAGGPDRPIKVLHPTFREFLLSDPQRTKGFSVNASEAHARIAIACINILERALRYDILHVEGPDNPFPHNFTVEGLEKLIVKHTTGATLYASNYWAHHVAESDLPDELWSKVLSFLSEKFLNWVELMSWRGGILTCIDGLSRVRLKAKNELLGNSNSLKRDLLVIQHAHQFLVRHQALLRESALQAYFMALFFTPKDSPMFDSYRRRHQSQLRNISTSHTVQWGNYMALGRHGDYIEQLLFSADGSRLMSLDNDGVLYVWDTTTGALVTAPAGDKKFAVPDIIGGVDCTFSLDGKLFAFATFQWQLHIRYSHNGEQAFPPLIHTRSEGSLVYSYVALSPKRAVLAEPQAVWILDLESGQEMQHLTIDYEGEVAVLDVAISPDSRTLVYIGKQSHLDRAIVWNLERREVIATFDMEAASIPYRAVVAFSNDSARVAIGAFYAATKLYNSTSMDEITTLMEDIQFRGEKLVTFCPRNLYLATGSRENPSVIIWGQELGNKVATLEGHTSGVVSISFSNDGERIASISTDQTVRVWNVSSGEPLESIFTGYMGDIRRCALSSDWTKLIAATAGNELHLYDLNAEQSGESAQGKHAEPPGVGVVFTASATGKILARSFAHFQGHRQMGVRLWETKTGKNLGMLDTGPHSVAGIAISPDDRLIVISMWSRTDLLIWDLDTRTKVQELDSQREGLEGLIFSSSSKVLAAWTFGHILICDLGSSKFEYKTIEGFENFLALSPDGTQFAGIRNTTLFVRNIASGVELLASGEVFYKGPCTFHPNGNLLAIVFHSQIVLIQVQQDSLQLLSKIRRGSPWMWSPTPDEHLSFSPDGQYLACSLECWDITSLFGILHTGNSPPASFTNPGSQRHSFLACHDGWVYSSYPPYPLFPIPSETKTTGEMSKELSWYAYGETLVLWNESGQPIVIDCAPMLARARQQG